MFSKSSLGMYLIYCPMLDCVLTGSFSQISSVLEDSFSRTGVKDYCLAHSSLRYYPKALIIP